MKYKCSLDVENNWTCDRNTIVNDENDCCDPIYHNNIWYVNVLLQNVKMDLVK